MVDGGVATVDVEPSPTRRHRGTGVIGLSAAVLLALAAVLAWAFFDVRQLDEYRAALGFEVAVCSAAVAPSHGHDLLAAAQPGLHGDGTVRVYGNHFNYRRFEFVTDGGAVIPLGETKGLPTRRYCV